MYANVTTCGPMGSQLEIVEGTENVFRDLGDPDADLKHARAILAADIISLHWTIAASASGRQAKQRVSPQPTIRGSATPTLAVSPSIA